MGLFNSIFGGKKPVDGKEEESTVWIPLQELEQLDKVEASSNDRPQFIFKHSTSCGISGMVLRMFRESYKLDSDAADLYYLDLHSYREISNEIASRFGVYHQSPQLLVIKDGLVVDHRSHGAITSIAVEQYL